MTNPYNLYGQEPGSGRSPDAADARRTQMTDMLRQALQNLQNNGASNEHAAITPEMLAELAQRAGIGGAGQLDLSRVMGAYASAGSTVPQVPQQIIFLLGDVECALPSEAVQGVERISDITPVPNTAPWVLGVVQSYGTIVSVVDLRLFLGLEPGQLTQRSRLLVVTENDMTIGFLVDVITEMRPLTEELARGDSSGVPAWARDVAGALVQVDGRPVIALDPHRLLFSDKIQHYRAPAEAR